MEEGSRLNESLENNLDRNNDEPLQENQDQFIEYNPEHDIETRCEEDESNTTPLQFDVKNENVKDVNEVETQANEEAETLYESNNAEISIPEVGEGMDNDKQRKDEAENRDALDIDQSINNEDIHAHNDIVDNKNDNIDDIEAESGSRKQVEDDDEAHLHMNHHQPPNDQINMELRAHDENDIDDNNSNIDKTDPSEILAEDLDISIDDTQKEMSPIMTENILKDINENKSQETIKSDIVNNEAYTVQDNVDNVNMNFDNTLNSMKDHAQIEQGNDTEIISVTNDGTSDQTVNESVEQVDEVEHVNNRISQESNIDDPTIHGIGVDQSDLNMVQNEEDHAIDIPLDSAVGGLGIDLTEEKENLLLDEVEEREEPYQAPSIDQNEPVDMLEYSDQEYGTNAPIEMNGHEEQLDELNNLDDASVPMEPSHLEDHLISPMESYDTHDSPLTNQLEEKLEESNTLDETSSPTEPSNTSEQSIEYNDTPLDDRSKSIESNQLEEQLDEEKTVITSDTSELIKNDLELDQQGDAAPTSLLDETSKPIEQRLDEDSPTANSKQPSQHSELTNAALDENDTSDDTPIISESLLYDDSNEKPSDDDSQKLSSNDNALLPSNDSQEKPSSNESETQENPSSNGHALDDATEETPPKEDIYELIRSSKTMLELIKRDLSERDVILSEKSKELEDIQTKCKVLSSSFDGGFTVEQLEEEFFDRIEKLQQRLSELEQERLMLDMALNKHHEHSKVEERTKERDFLKSQVATLNLTLSSLESNKKKLVDTKDNQHKEIMRLNDQIQSIEKNTKESKKRLRQVLDSRKRIQSTITDYTSINNNLKAEVENLLQEFRSKEQEYIELTEQSNKMKKDTASIRSEFERVTFLTQQDLDDIRDKETQHHREELQRIEENLLNHLQSTETEIIETNREYESLKELMVSKENDYKIRIESLKVQLEKVQSQNETLLSNTTDTSLPYKEQISDLKEELNKKNNDLEQLRQNNVRVMTELTESLNELKLKQEALRTIHDNYKIQYDDLQQKEDTQIRKIEEIHALILETKKSKQFIESEIADITASTNSLKSVITKKKEHSKFLMDRLNKVILEGEKRRKELEMRTKKKKALPSKKSPSSPIYNKKSILPSPDIHSLIKKQHHMGLVHSASLEILETSLKQRDAEIASLKEKNKQMILYKTELEEAANESRENLNELAQRVQGLKQLDEEKKLLEQKYMAALEILGEKTERIHQLKDDMIEWKELYEGQIEELTMQLKS